jgi:hypothetical protein
LYFCAEGAWGVARRIAETEEDIWSIFLLLIDLSENERKLTSP